MENIRNKNSKEYKEFKRRYRLYKLGLIKPNKTFMNLIKFLESIKKSKIIYKTISSVKIGDIDMSYGYEGINMFSVTVQKHDNMITLIDNHQGVIKPLVNEFICFFDEDSSMVDINNFVYGFLYDELGLKVGEEFTVNKENEE